MLPPENWLGLDRKYLKQKQAKTSEVLSNSSRVQVVITKAQVLMQPLRGVWRKGQRGEP